jgi:hypothetical protein
MGYVSCIISDLIPEEALDFHLENERLHIHLLKRDLDPSTKEKLLQRLKKQNFLRVWILLWRTLNFLMHRSV